MAYSFQSDIFDRSARVRAGAAIEPERAPDCARRAELPSVLSYVVTTAVLYIGVGYFMGRRLLKSRLPTMADLERDGRTDTAEDVRAGNDSETGEWHIPENPFSNGEEFATATFKTFDLGQLPGEWAKMIQSLDPSGEKTVCNSAVEASVYVLKLEVGSYRHDLANIDTNVRNCLKSPDAQKLQDSVEQLKQVNDNWRSRQQEATQYLSAQKRSMGDMSPLGERLEEVLVNQTAQIDTTSGNIEMFDFQSSPIIGARRLIIEIRKLVDLAHTLRDCMQEFLVAILCREGRIHETPKYLEQDSLTGLRNRTGIETFMRRWWRDDQKRLRQVSVAMLDLDQFARLTEGCGPVVTDRLLAALARLVDDLLRKYSGLDWCGRFAGQRLFVFWADTGPHGASSVVERIRQTIAQTTFRYSKGDLTVTFTAAVTEVLGNDGTKTLFDRLTATLQEAKQSRRNCTYLHVGGGAHLVQPPQFDVRGKVVDLVV
jgi:diguanylate cyclase (GGDEF)-like protein